MPTREKLDSLVLLEGVRRVFADSPDYDSTLSAIAHLVLPYLGSWCAVDVCEEDGAMRRLAVIHPDSTKAPLVQALEKGWPPEVDDPLGAPAVMRTRKTVWIPHVTDALLREVARTPDNLRALLALGIGSVITVPLMTRDSVLGAITFVSDATGHDYDASDVALAEGLASIAALALDNARLHHGHLGRVKEESANKARTEFLSTMSHEIRTPLNAIVGYSELLELGLAGPLSERQSAFISRLRMSATHLVGLVNDVLDLAKADAGKLSMAREVAGTGEAISTAIATMLPAARAAQVSLVHSCTSANGDSVSYVGDEGRVRQIIINLLANAIKFTPPSGTVTLSCGAVEENPTSTHLAGLGPWSFVRVVDSGAGVASDQRAAIFEPFVQGETGYTRSKGGTGLGLTISRRLARLMGGDLVLSSEAPGTPAGATFTLWMPSTKGVGGGQAKEVAEPAAARVARALDAHRAYRSYALAEIGKHLRDHVEEVLRAVTEQLRSDSAFPSTDGLSPAEVEDHQLAFLIDVAQSLVVIDETGGVSSNVYRDGSDIQRIVCALHGTMRQQQAWTLEQLDLESVLVHNELNALIHRHVPDDVGDVAEALAAIDHLVEQGRVVSAQAFRQAARRSHPPSHAWTPRGVAAFNRDPAR